MKRKTWLSSGLAVSAGALLPLLPTPARADWSVQYGNGGDNRSYSAATDSAGNVFTGGYTVAGIFGQSSLGWFDGYVAKFNSGGTLEWSHLFGASNSDFVMGVTAVGTGSVAAAGSIEGPLQPFPNPPDIEAMVRLYDATGATTWTRQFGTAGQDFARAVSADGAGHLYVGGFTTGSFSGFTNAGGNDLFVTQLDATTGAVNWTFQLGTTSDDRAVSLAADSAGNVYLGGFTGGTLPGQTTAGETDGFVLKLDVSGALLWTRQFGSAGPDEVLGVAVDSTGAVLTAGTTTDTLGGQTSAGGDDAFVEKRDANGNVIWTRQFGTAGQEGAYGVVINGANQVIVGGYTDGVFPGEINAGGTDAFVRVFNPDGSVDFTNQLGGAGFDFVAGVAADTLGNAYLAGSTLGALPGQTNAGGYDAFLIQTAVPEPNTAGLLALGLLALPRRRRARGRCRASL